MCRSGAMCPGGMQLWGTIVGERLPSSWGVGSVWKQKGFHFCGQEHKKNVKSWARMHTSWECLSVVFILTLSHCISGSLCAELLWGLQGGKLPVGHSFGTGVLVISVCQTLLYCIL